MSVPSVAIIILNWNGWQDTLECLESLSKTSYPNYQIIVVDNGSTDGSAEKIEKWSVGKGLPLIVIRAGSNLGFARGNNHGIRYALEKYDPQYILALNNDALVEPDCLKIMIDRLEEDKRAGLVGPLILDYQDKKSWLRPLPKRLNLITYILFATQLYWVFSRYISIDRSEPSYVYELPGCCLLFRTKALVDIGLFDEQTFLGWEEFIVAEKLYRLGWRSLFVPQSRIYHKTGQSTSKLPNREKLRRFLQSERYYQTAIMRYNIFFRAVIRLVRSLIFFFMTLTRCGKAVPK